jgi:hypothetical protein
LSLNLIRDLVTTAMVQAQNSAMQYPSAVQQSHRQPLNVQQPVQSPVANVTGSGDSRRQLSPAQALQMELEELHKEKQRIQRDQEALLMKVPCAMHVYII